jgi:chromate transporter
VLFAQVDHLRFGVVSIPWPRLATLRPDTLGLSVLAAVLLFRLHLGVVKTVGALAVAGLLVSLARGAWG